MDGLAELLAVSAEVAAALAGAQPVVALESAVISHGLPHPVSLSAAAAVEDAVRRTGAVPATVAVIDGRITVGVTADALAKLVMPQTMKVASRDLPVAAARGASGGTTVSATIEVASLAGIDVIATGGIGGVHRGAETTGDVSADLRALAETSVIVVCSGAKAICDVDRTLEYLETTGVTTVAYGTDRFPYFYARDSGRAAPQQARTPEEVAGIFRAKRALRQRPALLVANPVPLSDALPADEVDAAVARAVAQAEAAHVRGGDLTPHLLAVIGEMTGGRSLRANLALLRSNAALAGGIATALARPA